MLFGEHIHKAKILLVDDNPVDSKIATAILKKDGYNNVCSTNDPREALALYRQLQPDVLLLDIHMPNMSGFDVMTQILQDYPDQYLPIIILTSDHRDDVGSKALSGGAQDFVTKPFNATELSLRVGNVAETHRLHRTLQEQNAALEVTVQERTEKIHQSRIKLIQCLAKAAEFKDNETGMHVVRISKTCRIVAIKMGLEDKWVNIITLASPMHDVGKIGIPDKILLKPGKLHGQEWEVMKSHAELGANILADNDSELLTAAATIARTHHERWDGQGYPAGLTAEQIPILTRIVTVCDVFDALTSVRPYKQAWPASQAMDYIKDNSGKQFDPSVVHHFEQVLDQVLAVRSSNPDPGNH